MRPPSKLPLARRRALTVAALAALTGVAALGAVATAPLSAPEASGGLSFASPVATVTSASSLAVDALTMSEADARRTVTAGQKARLAAAEMSEAIDASGLDLGVDTAPGTAGLTRALDELDSVTIVPMLLFPDLADDVARETRLVEERTDGLRTALDAAVAKKAADDAAAEAAAEAHRQAQAAAAALAQANTPDGARATARAMAAERYGWGEEQFSCLSSLWQKESNWNYQAYNASSGATGIPQALPGSKMAAAGPDWQSNAATQIAWGLDYIDRAYGAPCSAWGHSQSTDWY